MGFITQLVGPNRPRSCGYAKRYLGLRAPACNGGAGCAACLEKWKQVQAQRARKGQR